MKIEFAKTKDEIARCFDVMSQLRPHLSETEFIEQTVRQLDDGFHLVYLEDAGEIKALAGFRTGEMLHRGRYMYVDDLVTDAASRSKGYGDRLFDWLIEHAKAERCQQFHLDSGVQRFDAHRFYFRKRMKISAYHFQLEIE